MSLKHLRGRSVRFVDADESQALPSITRSGGAWGRLAAGLRRASGSNPGRPGDNLKVEEEKYREGGNDAKLLGRTDRQITRSATTAVGPSLSRSDGYMPRLAALAKPFGSCSRLHPGLLSGWYDGRPSTLRKPSRNAGAVRLLIY